jgi:hypothetical protein
VLRRNVVSILFLIGATLAVSACGSGAQPEEAGDEPATVESVEGSNLSRVILTPGAAKRIGLEMAPVRITSVDGGFVVRGQVVKPPVASGSSVWIRVPVRAGALGKVDRSKPARVLSLGGAAGLIASPVAGAPQAGETVGALYYRLDGAGGSPNVGTPVRVAVSLKGRGARLTIPYSAVIYWIDGGTWVYTNTTSLTFVRHRISIDEISGDVAVLKSGPPAGTRVVTIGGEELLGTEFAIEGE